MPSCFPPPLIVVGTGLSDRPQARELAPAHLQTCAHDHAHIWAPHPISAEGVTLLWNALVEAQTRGIVTMAQITGPKARVGSSRFFGEAQRRVVAPPVPYVWDATSTST